MNKIFKKVEWTSYHWKRSDGDLWRAGGWWWLGLKPQPQTRLFSFNMSSKNFKMWNYREFYFLFIFLKIFYLFIHERHTKRGRDIGRGRSRLPEGGAWCGTISQDPRIMTWAKGRHPTNWATQVSQYNVILCSNSLYGILWIWCIAIRTNMDESMSKYTKCSQIKVTTTLNIKHFIIYSFPTTTYTLRKYQIQIEINWYP